MRLSIYRLAVNSLLLALLALLAGSSARAARPTDELLPADTKGYLSSTDVQAMVEQWNETNLGRMADDPKMQPFVEDLREQLRNERTEDRIDWAPTWDEVQAVARGEAALAVSHVKGQRPATIILIDVTNNGRAAADLLGKIFQRLARGARATWRQDQVQGAQLTTFNLPTSTKDPQRAPQVAYFIKENMLGAVDNAAVAREIMGRFSGEPRGALVSLAPYRKIMDRCQADAQATEAGPAQARWYFNPLEYAQARRVVEPEFLVSDGRDMIDVMENSGFGGFRGVGGLVHLVAGPYDVLHRIAVYAPPPYEQSMKMFETPNAGPFPPMDWLPASLATYTSGSWNLKTAIDNFAPFYDQTIGGGDVGAWESTLVSIRDDEEGPKVDMQKRVFDHLGGRATYVTDVVEPITPTSERSMMIGALTDAAAVQKALDDYYANDQLAEKRKIGDHRYWAIKPEEFEEEPRRGRGRAGAGAAQGPQLSGLAVFKDHLLIASHVGLLEDVLKAQGKNPLSEDPKYREVARHIEAELEKRSWSKYCIQQFVRSDVYFMPTYELTRMGQLPAAETMLGQLLDTVLDPGAGGQPRKQQVDGKKLPPYESVRHYLTPAGGLGVREEGEFEGWFLLDFILSK